MSIMMVFQLFVLVAVGGTAPGGEIQLYQMRIFLAGPAEALISCPRSPNHLGRSNDGFTLVSCFGMKGRLGTGAKRGPSLSVSGPLCSDVRESPELHDRRASRAPGIVP